MSTAEASEFVHPKYGCLDQYKEREPDEKVPVTVEVLVPNECGWDYVVTKRFRTPKEIAADLDKHLNLIACNECGKEWPYKYRERGCRDCGDDANVTMLIDEYSTCCHFQGDELMPIAPRNHHVCEIAVYSHVGSNEGYGMHVTVVTTDGHELKWTPVYRIKSFNGMRHCHNLAERTMKLLGVWPEWCKD